jgi:hypothetical protein
MSYNFIHSMKHLSFLVLTLTSPALAQVHFGVEAGIPITETMHTSAATATGNALVSDAYSSNTKRLLIGPTVNVALPLGFHLQFDALYQRVNYEHTLVISQVYTSETFSRNTANRWQFPLLVQYHVKVPVLKPFVEVGPSFSHISGGSNVTTRQDNIFGSFQGTTSKSSTLSELRHSTVAGVTAGLGLSLHFWRTRIAPEFRFTHWASAQFEATSEFADLVRAQLPSAKTPSISSNRNQVDFLLGITF